MSNSIQVRLRSQSLTSVATTAVNCCVFAHIQGGEFTIELIKLQLKRCNNAKPGANVDAAHYTRSPTELTWNTMRTQGPPWWRICAFLAFLAVGIVLATTVQLPSITEMRQWVDSYGQWSIALFALLYVTVTQFPIPRTALTVSSGLLFGPVLGIGIALLGTTLAALINITLVRALLGSDPEGSTADSWTSRLARTHRNHKALTKINQRLQHRGFFSIFCLRLIPGIPFSVLNYACAITPVKRKDFTLATLCGSAPSTIIGVLLGDSVALGENNHAALLLGTLFIIGVLGFMADLLLPVKSKT